MSHTHTSNELIWGGSAQIRVPGAVEAVKLLSQGQPIYSGGAQVGQIEEVSFQDFQVDLAAGGGGGGLSDGEIAGIVIGSVVGGLVVISAAVGLGALVGHKMGSAQSVSTNSRVAIS